MLQGWLKKRAQRDARRVFNDAFGSWHHVSSTIQKGGLFLTIDVDVKLGGVRDLFEIVQEASVCQDERLRPSRNTCALQ